MLFFSSNEPFILIQHSSFSCVFLPQVKLELIRQAENLEQVKDILEDKASEVGSPSTVASWKKTQTHIPGRNPVAADQPALPWDDANPCNQWGFPTGSSQYGCVGWVCFTMQLTASDWTWRSVTKVLFSFSFGWWTSFFFFLAKANVQLPFNPF